MRRNPFASALAFALALAPTFASADKPFPDNKGNHWAYVSMIQIKKDHLWYRAYDKIPKKKALTRNDFATKTIYLALDSQHLIEGFRETTSMVSRKADNAKTRAWAQQYTKSFPAKKKLYQRYLLRVTRLWNYFRKDIEDVAKTMKVDTKLVSQNLNLERITLNNIQLPRKKKK